MSSKEKETKSSYKMFKIFKRNFRLNEAEPPLDVKEAFSKYSDGNNLMTSDQLLNFLISFQGESDAKIEDADKIVSNILQARHHIAQFTRSNTLTLDDFHHYLFDGELNFPINPQVYHDMTAPLSHYFIYTGHNSYLTGNQLNSESSCVPIINALKNGVRVIELDIWPNSAGDNIKVYHGRTLTSPVKFIDCLKSIREHAFVASEYPLVVTLEDHLTPELQAKAAEMITQTLKDLLFTSLECLEEFPSPEELKGKILLSTKPPKEYLYSKGFDEEKKDSCEKEAPCEEVVEDKNDIDAEDSDQCEDSSGESEDTDNSEDKSCPLGVQKYKSLIAIHAKKHKGGLTKSLKLDPGKVERLSLSEQQLEKGAENHGTELVRFTQRNLLRIFPKGTRFNSSNYNPLIGWMHGAQMVAFNMQGYGKQLWIMQGLFRSNGGCGYVKKPDLLMRTDEGNKVFNPKEKLPVKTCLKVRVYMGDGWRLDFKPTHFDTYSPPDFYVKVHIVGVPADAKRRKTKFLEDTWTPVWNQEFLFPLRVPDLAILRLEVRDYDKGEKDDFAGQSCFPVRELRPGIRTVPLYDRDGKKFNSTKLLMRFEFV
ncbi:hypothetical protein C5167_028566 [Papaver somniferum]|uniref:phosphoinositide phospholipase C 6-like n=1 Tax=Papaver somniferum TaxID=3469 RepID=UPI000E6F8DF0|nr:phosphoinositide phospholipase C 6-like [Papaver somniferum]RZC90732.1 hypothetical protein C5167_028566 [Papaver somniferum]